MAKQKTCTPIIPDSALTKMNARPTPIKIGRYVIRRVLKSASDKKPICLYWRSDANRSNGGWVEWQSLATRFASKHACRVELSDKIGTPGVASTQSTIVRLKTKGKPTP